VKIGGFEFVLEKCFAPRVQPLLGQPKVGRRMQICWAKMLTLNAFWNSIQILKNDIKKIPAQPSSPYK